MSLRSRSVLALASLSILTAAAIALQPPPGGGGQPPAGQPNQPGPRGPGGGGGGGGGGGRGPGGGGGGERQISVDGAMKGMNRALRQLGEQVTDATKKDENLRLINDAQRSCVMAKGQPVPADILKDAKDDAARAKLSADYRAHLMAALRTMLDAEQSIIEGKGDAAKAKLAELGKLRDTAHGQLGVKEE